MPKAYVYTAHGGPEVEAFVDLPRPAPGPGEILVAVRAAGVNPADWKRREGLRAVDGEPRFPTVLGGKVAGVAAAPKGIDAIYDLVGGDALEEVAPLLTDRSKLITGADRELVARLGGVPVARARNRAVLDAVARLAVEGVLNPHVTATFPLDQAPKALRAVEDGHAQGKLVIEIPA